MKFQAVNYQYQNEYYGFITLDEPWGGTKRHSGEASGIASDHHTRMPKEAGMETSVPTDTHRWGKARDAWQLNTPGFFLDHQYKLHKDRNG